MMKNHRHFVSAIALITALAESAAAYGQDAKAPADQAAPPKAADQAPAEKAGPPKAAPAKKPGAAEEAPAYRPADPAVDTIVESKPTTPRGMLQAAISLAALDRPDLAKQFLDQLLATKPDAAALADLARQFGSDALLQLAGNKLLNPQAQRVVDQIFAAAAAERRDPTRLAAFSKQLSDPSPDRQLDAATALRDAGAAAVPLLVKALADPAQAKAHALAHEVLTSIGQGAVSPLVAAISAPNSAMQAAAISALGEIRAQQDTVPYLLVPYLSAKSAPEVRQAAATALKQLVGSLPTKADAVTILSREARSYLKRERPLAGDETANVAIWHWDPAAKTLVSQEYSPARASAFIAARLAGDLLALDPQSVADRRMYLISLLESAVYRAGIDNPLPTGPGMEYGEAVRFGIDAVNDALAEALVTGHVAAAKGAAQILGDSGDVRLLTAAGALPSPLVQALRSHDGRLRVAAAQAVMKLKPTAAFAGSSYLTDLLADMSGATGRRRAAIAFPTLEILQQLAGMTNSLGFETDTATNGQQLFAAATASPDIELILVSARINHSTAVEVVQQLREDPRTADIPICVMAELDERAFAEQSFRGIPGVFVELRPPSLAEMKRIAARGAQMAGDRLVPVKLRQQEAVWALDALAALAVLPPEIANVRRYESTIERALYSPLTSSHAAAVLAQLGTPSSQRALVDLASIGSQPIEIRKAAGAAFRQSIRQFGLRLSPSEILTQYDRFNQSAKLDNESQRLLGALLDVIEQQGRGTRGAGRGTPK
jgi:CheY-like chemotaxis protein